MVLWLRYFAFLGISKIGQQVFDDTSDGKGRDFETSLRLGVPPDPLGHELAPGAGEVACCAGALRPPPCDGYGRQSKAGVNFR